MRWLIGILFLFFGLQVSAQLSTIKSFDHHGGGRIRSVFDNDKNLYVVCYAQVLFFGTQGNGLMISKYDPNGKPLWNKLYKQDNRINSFFVSFTNNKVHISGNLYDSNGGCQDQAYIFNIDTNGQIIRSTNYKLDGKYMWGASGISEDAQGNIYFATVGGYPACSGTYYGYLVSMDSLLNIRFVKRTMDDIYSYSTTSVIGDRIILGHSYGYYIFSTAGQFLEGYTLKSTQGVIYFSDTKVNQNGIYQLWTYSNAGKYSYKLFRFDDIGKISNESSIYYGYATGFRFDPDGNLHLLTPPNSGEDQTNVGYQLFDKDLNLQDNRVLKHDSLYAWSNFIPYCAERIKVFSVLPSLHPLNEIDVVKEQQGPGILFRTTPPTYINDVISYIPDALTNIDASWQQSPFNLTYYADTVLIPDTIYRYPDCQAVDLLGNDTILCDPNPLQLTAPVFTPAEVCDRSVLEYNWTTDQTSNSIQVTRGGLYKLKVDHANCIYEDSIHVSFDSAYNAPAPYYEHCFDNSAMFTIGVDPQLKGVWNTGDSLSLNATGPGIYNFSGTSSLGCSIQYETIINNKCGYMLYLPSSFTPDDDGYNEYFKPVGEALSDWKLTVHDRWGHPLWKGDQSSLGWDGKNSSGAPISGIFAYQFEYFDADSQAKKVIFGKVFCLR